MINCGMRLIKTDLTIKDVQPRVKELVDTLFKNVPAGVGCKGFVKLNNSQFDDIMTSGVKWCVENGYGWKEDLEKIEDYGCLEGADPGKVSQKARSRGINQLGTLGSGNHYLEVQVAHAEHIFDETTAKKIGIVDRDQVLIMLHCGSRGFGHQLATDYMKIFDSKMKDYGIKIPDRELSCAPFQSKEGQDYYSAMKAAGNMAYCNRQVILHQIRDSFKKVFNQDPEKMGMDLIYDCTHNIARKNKITVDGKKKEVLVHLKGATTSLGAGNERIVSAYKNIGTPIIIGGSMETGSYLLKGTKKAEEATFGTTCFTEGTKVITDKGLVKIGDIYKRYYGGEEFLVPSLNESSLEIEWKSITDCMKKSSSDIIEVSISQRGGTTLNRLRTTKDHKFVTIDDGNIVHKPVKEIIGCDEGILLLDNIKFLLESNVSSEMAYLVGAIMSDGSFRADERHGNITFTQKQIPEKIKFIDHVNYCFQEVFSYQLREGKIKAGGGSLNGRQILGYATDFHCYSQIASFKMKEIYENIDSWVLSLSQKATINFLAGLIDGDGTWNKKRKILQIYASDSKIVGAIVLACLKLGILPYISKQRDICYIIQISEKENLLFHYTKRIRYVPKRKKYGAKLYLAKQIFKEFKETKWPFLHKAKRNNLMSDRIISEHIHKYPLYEEKIRKLISSCLRMQRIKHVRDLEENEVYNITVDGNHNYFVMTDMFIPVLVKNCHGAGRKMSRTQAKKMVRGENLQKEMEKKGIYVKGVSMSGLAEEGRHAYKEIDEVINSVNKAGISESIVKLSPIANVKG